MEENNNQPNLIQKTVGRVSNKLRGSKIFKRIGALVIACVIATSLSACATHTTDPTPSPAPNPSVTEVCDECGGNHKTEDHQKQVESEYSDLFRSVVNNEEYKRIAKESIESMYSNKGHVADNYRYLLNQHPYGFLAEKGYDIDAIKNGQLSCQTCSFVKDDEPTKLYIGTRVQTSKVVDDSLYKCYDHYLISYDLTKKEMEDYICSYNQRYVYSNFLNDAISKQKKATVHNVAYTTLGVGNELFTWAKKMGDGGKVYADYLPFKDLKEFVLLSFNEQTSEVTLVGLTSSQAHYITTKDGSYIWVDGGNVLKRLGNACGEKPETEPKVYDVKYFNKTWIDCANSEYNVHTRGDHGYNILEDYKPGDFNKVF